VRQEIGVARCSVSDYCMERHSQHLKQGKTRGESGKMREVELDGLLAVYEEDSVGICSGEPWRERERGRERDREEEWS
jgi:hypothetical protein